jgi:hypothetical protein
MARSYSQVVKPPRGVREAEAHGGVDQVREGLLSLGGLDAERLVQAGIEVHGGPLGGPLLGGHRGKMAP